MSQSKRSKKKAPRTRSQPLPKKSAPPSAQTELPYVAGAHQYARDVVAGRIDVCKWVRLACQRHLNDLLKSRKPDFRWKFDEAKAARVCRFIEFLPHVKGKWAASGESIHLGRWQLFILCGLFGWVDKETGLRRFRRAYICVPRKNGKSIIAGGIGDYMFCADEEFGAEVYSGATTEAQAWEVFRPAKQMLERTPRLSELFGVQVNASNMVRMKDGSRFLPVIGKPGDGSSPSCAIIDEYHEHQTDELYDTMQTGMGARTQPLLLAITTAGSNIAGPCYSLQEELQKVLEGATEDDGLFGVIYTLDEEDDWTTEEALRKANPNYDVSVFGSFLQTEQARAVANSRKQNIFKTKHLNVWVNASTGAFNMQKWKTIEDKSLKPEQFVGLPCVIAADLSAKLDITSTIKVFTRLADDGEPHFYVFGRHYLPEDRAAAPEFQHYQAWVHDGHLTQTDGAVIDYAQIHSDLVKDITDYRVSEFAFDPWGATQLAQDLEKETFVTPIEVPQNVQHLSESMKWLDAMIAAGRIHHDGNPVLNWMMSNVTVKPGQNDSWFPRKEKPENKIDGAVALIMALGRARVAENTSSVYETEGILYF